MIRLTDVPEVGRVDGSWRDLYVLGTSAAGWNVLLDLVRSGKMGDASFLVDGEPSAMPDRVEEVLAIHDRASPMLRLSVDGLNLNCHFFVEGEIEFDLDPAELTEPRFAALLAWMRLLGTALRRDVLLTDENSKKVPRLMFCAGIDRVLAITGIDREEWE